MQQKQQRSGHGPAWSRDSLEAVGDVRHIGASLQTPAIRRRLPVDECEPTGRAYLLRHRLSSPLASAFCLNFNVLQQAKTQTDTGAVYSRQTLLLPETQKAANNAVVFGRPFQQACWRSAKMSLQSAAERPSFW